MKIIKYFFLILGVIFFGILVAIGYVWVTDWSGIRTVVTSGYEIYQGGEVDMGLLETVAGNTQLLEELSTGETTLTEAQIKCLNEKLGSERVNEIYVTGEQPTAKEIMIGLTCL